MNYKNRLLEQRVKELAGLFKIVLLAGARQVGKSSLLAHLFPSTTTFVFDPVQDLYGARQGPDLFLDSFARPLILDEVQYVPELLPSLKRKVDTAEDKGQYLLTGSQQLSILKTVSESLAGRVAIVELGPMTLHEMYGNVADQQSSWLERYLADPHLFQKNFLGTITNLPPLYEILVRGGMPGTIDLPLPALATYFSSYLQTYVERDVRLLENIQDVALFGRFFALLSALTAQEINYTQLGREIGISPATVQRWLHVLQYTYQWSEVAPYHGNMIKRISSKPKGLFADTGMACYLQRISAPAALAGHPWLGALFESFCVAMIKGLSNALGTAPLLYHWRTMAGAEVDLILERDGKLYPIEMKCKSNLTGHDTRGLQAFRETYSNQNIMPGLILYAGDRCYWVDKNTVAFPWCGI
jgi:predicted AAA+ superfamily ATPase